MREVNNKLGRTVVAGETLMYKKGSTGKSSAVPNQMVRRWRRVMLLPDGSSWPVVLLVPLLYVTTQWSMLDVLERRSRPSVRKRSASKAKRNRRARSRCMFGGEHSLGVRVEYPTPPPHNVSVMRPPPVLRQTIK